MTRPPPGFDPLGVFTGHRGLLFTIAYEILGSTADADDVLQDSWLRWSGVDHHTVADPRAYLVRVVTRQALNRLRSARRRREEYVGPWLPEPLITAGDVADDVALADSVSFALLVVLETLTPLERAAFVLREVFGFSYDEVAAAVDRAPGAVRQLVSRARRHVREQRPRATRDADHAAVVEQFFAATATGDVQGLLDLLAPDAVLTTDGGGQRKAALRPIAGAEKVARFLVAVAPVDAELEVAWITVNGSPGLALWVDGALDSVGTGVVVDGRVTELFLVRNPEKLVDIAPRPISRG